MTGVRMKKVRDREDTPPAPFEWETLTWDRIRRTGEIPISEIRMRRRPGLLSAPDQDPPPLTQIRMAKPKGLWQVQRRGGDGGGIPISEIRMKKGEEQDPMVMSEIRMKRTTTEMDPRRPRSQLPISEVRMKKGSDGDAAAPVAVFLFQEDPVGEYDDDDEVRTKKDPEEWFGYVIGEDQLHREEEEFPKAQESIPDQYASSGQTPQSLQSPQPPRSKRARRRRQRSIFSGVRLRDRNFARRPRMSQIRM